MSRIKGSKFADNLNSRATGDWVQGLKGNDALGSYVEARLDGGLGDDQISLYTGKGLALGGGGDDLLFAGESPALDGAGNAVLNGGRGVDTFMAGFDSTNGAAQHTVIVGFKSSTSARGQGERLDLTFSDDGVVLSRVDETGNVIEQATDFLAALDRDHDGYISAVDGLDASGVGVTQLNEHMTIHALGGDTVEIRNVSFLHIGDDIFG